MHLLITGATGFIGRHVTAEALAQGHRVRATMRDLSRAGDLRAHLGPGPLEPVALDLMQDTGWDAAMAGIDGLLHTASPVPVSAPNSEREVLGPAVEGTRRVLQAAARAGVPRVVVTSSIAAILGDPRKGPMDLYTAEDWTDPEAPKVRTYAKSKVLAEREARRIAAETPGLHLATVNPGFVFGAPLGSGVSSSLVLIDRLLRGKDPMLPRLSFPSVSVRDVAEAHLRALMAADGARIVASGETLWISEIAEVVREAVPGARPARLTAPDWLVRLLARFSPSLRMVASGVGRAQRTDPGTCEALLGRPLQDPRIAIAEAARALARR